MRALRYPAVAVGDYDGDGEWVSDRQEFVS